MTPVKIKTKTQYGFTLIELMVVISIISLLSSVILASLGSARDRGQIASQIVFDTHVYHAIGDSVLGYWPLTDGSGTTVKDTSGNNNTGTINGGATWAAGVSPNKEYALSLSGSSNDIEINASQTIDSITGPFTISGWVYDTSVANTNQIFFVLRNNSQSTGQYIQFYSSASYGAPANCSYAPYIGVTGGTGNLDICGSAPLTKNKWHQLTGTFDGSTVKLYIDGKLDRSANTTLASTLNLSNTMAQIGNDGWSAWFKGYVSGVRLYKTAVTGEAIHKLFAEESNYYENLALKQP